MKIAVFHNLPSGGAKRALYGFVKYLTETGHTVNVFIPSTANENFLPLRDFADKVTVFPVKKTLIGCMSSTIRYIPPVRYSLADLERTQKDIANAINGGDYDVVFSEQDRYTFSPFFLKFIKKPTVYYCPQPLRLQEAILQKVSQKSEDRSWPGLGRRIWRKYVASRMPKIDKQNASFTKYILTNSYFSRESILRSYGLNSFVCYLGIDTEIFRPIEASKENFVLSVGSCTVAKGYDFIVNSLAHVNVKLRPKFIIISNVVDARWKHYLEQLAKQKGIEIEIKTLVGENELVQFYSKAKLFLYAPYLEPFGLAPLEAMACGTPVVAVKEGGVRESVLHNETGLLTERDELIFAEAVTELLLDEKKRQSMSRRGIEVVQGFWTLRHAGERLLWHLNRAISLC